MIALANDHRVDFVTLDEYANLEELWAEPHEAFDTPIFDEEFRRFQARWRMAELEVQKRFMDEAAKTPTPKPRRKRRTAAQIAADNAAAAAAKKTAASKKAAAPK